MISNLVNNYRQSKTTDQLVKKIQKSEQVNSMEFQGIKTTATFQPSEICKNLPDLTKRGKIQLSNAVITNSVYNIVQEYFRKQNIDCSYISDITLTKKAMFDLITNIETALGIEINECVLDHTNAKDFIDYVESNLN